MDRSVGRRVGRSVWAGGFGGGLGRADWGPASIDDLPNVSLAVGVWLCGSGGVLIRQMLRGWARAARHRDACDLLDGGALRWCFPPGGCWGDTMWARRVGPRAGGILLAGHSEREMAGERSGAHRVDTPGVSVENEGWRCRACIGDNACCDSKAGMMAAGLMMIAGSGIDRIRVDGCGDSGFGVRWRVAFARRTHDRSSRWSDGAACSVARSGPRWSDDRGC